MKAKVLQIIKDELGENYKEADALILENILDRNIIDAISFSNRENNDENLLLLSPEIIEATIIAYQKRGVESVKSQGELGQSNTFVDYTEKLRNDIIKNGKRLIW